MNDQCYLVGSMACLAIGSMVWEFGQQRRVSWPAAFVGFFSIFGLSYLAINPVAEVHGVVKRQTAPITNSVVGIQNISLEDPLLERMRDGALIATDKHKSGLLPGYSRKIAKAYK